MTIVLLVLLSSLSFLSGFASLKIDPKTEPKKTWVLVVFLVLSIGGSLVTSLKDNSEKMADHATAQAQALTDQQRINSLVSSVQVLSGKSDQILNVLRQWGFSPAALERVQQSQDADQARASLLEQTKASNAQHQTTVLYFPKDVDGPKVIAALEQGGFSVRSQRAGERNQIATNAVWVGDAVADDPAKFVVAKFVVLTLIRAGVEIKAVRRLRNSAGERANFIEVGADPDVQRLPSLTVADVNNMASLPSRK